MQTSHLKNIINNLLKNSLRILKDHDYQRKVWFKHESQDESLYSETVYHFLENTEKILMDKESIQQLGNENFYLLKKLHNLVESHTDSLEENGDPDFMGEEEILNNSNWNVIKTLSEILYNNLAKFILRNCDGN